MIIRQSIFEEIAYSKSIVATSAQNYKGSSFDQTGYSILCKIHKIFQDDNGENSHNCFACNLDNMSTYLLKSLSNSEMINNQFDAFITFCLPAYLLVERFEEVFKILKLPD